MKRVFKWLGILLLIILLLLLLVLGAGYFLLGTDKGFSLAVQQADKRVDALEIDGVTGNLVNGFGTNEFSFKNESLSLQTSGLTSAWRLSCLTQRELCLDKIIVDEISVETFPTDKPVEEPASGPIELPEINLPINVTIDEILIRKFSFKAPGNAPAQVVDNIRLSAHTEGNKVTLGTIAAEYQNYSANIHGDITLQDNYPLDITVRAIASDLIPDTLPEGSGEQPATVDIRLTNSLRNLDIETHAAGSVQASLIGSVQPLEKDLPANLTFNSAELGWPLSSKSQVVANDTSVSIDGTLADYDLSVSTHVKGEQIPATSLDLQGKANTERATFALIDINTLGGTAKGTADVSWVDTLNWQTQWNVKNIDPSLQVPDLNGNLNATVKASGQVVDGNWTVDVPRTSVNGELRGYPFDLLAILSKGLDNVWNINTVKLNNGNNQVDASGTVSDVWKIKALIDMPELQNIMPELGGGIKANLDVKGPLQTPNVDLAANSSAVQFNDITVDGFSLKTTIRELFIKPSDVTLAIGLIKSGEQKVQNARLKIAGTRKKHTLTLFADGPQATAINLDLSGSLNSRLDWKGSLDKVDLEVPAHMVKLKHPTELSWNNRHKLFAIDAHCWVTEDSNLCLENKVIADKTGTATLSLDQYALNRLAPFLPAETAVKGTLKLDSTVQWGEDQTGSFAGTLNAMISDGGARALDANEEVVNFNYDSLSLAANLNPSNVEADVKLVSDTLGQADLSVTMDPSGEEKPINGTINLQGFDIGIAKAFLPDFDVITGTLSVTGDLSGKLTDPRFDGEILLDKPVIKAEILPLPLTGGRIVTTVKGKRAVIGGKLNSDEGHIDIDGNANWLELDAWNAEVNLVGDGLNIQSDPIQESTVNHSIKISAQPGILRVNGNIDIPQAVIDVEELPQGAASVSSDVVIIEDIEEKAAKKEVKPPSATQLLVALNVTLGDDVELSAYGLTANLEGDMGVRLKGSNPPQLSGKIEVVDGIYKQYGQNLNATGEVLFVGPVNQSRLAIDAIREIDGEDRTAGLRIQGTVATPEIVLFTEPADKPQDSILSYIVLGRDINETSDQEANLLATAALALTVKGGRNIAGGVADALGIQDFSFETRGRGDDTELVVSGRVSERLLLRYGRSVFAPDSTLYLRYDLTKKLYLEAAQNAEQAVDLFYSFSF